MANIKSAKKRILVTETKLQSLKSTKLEARVFTTKILAQERSLV